MFTLLDTEVFPKRRLTAKRYRHECGLEVVSLEAADSENLFALCFGTVPENDTGVAHILEHSVLEGSEKYPVKDPFVCLLKNSVATFINALTYPDRTIYPCTTCCAQDYFNLFEVYWDAVFHPKLTRDTFGQEGWHYEVQGRGKNAKLRCNGIVLNEMSGYYSDPCTVLGRAMERGLFGDTPLRYDSGGVPQAIPRLTYAEFLRFHARHYAPGVAKIVLYGDIPTEEKLAFIERHLAADLPRLSAAPAAPVRKPLRAAAAKPRVCREGFVPENGQDAKRGICAVAWALDGERSPELELGFQLLDAVLMGNSGSPLGKALLESGLGKAPLPSGYDNETKYLSFDVAMRGVRPRDFGKFERLVLDTLRRLVSEGLDPDQVEAAVAGFALANQSITSRYVIDLLDDIVASWNYSDDPYRFVRLAEAMPQFEEMRKSHPRYFEDLIQKWLLDNPRRIRIELVPDAGLKKRRQAAMEARMARTLARWTPTRLERARKFAAKLQEQAVRPDSPEALATLPQLTRADLPRRLSLPPCRDLSLKGGLVCRRGEVFDNGISYLSLIGDAASLPPRLQPWLPVFTSLFAAVGNESMSYDQFGTEMARLGCNFALSSAIGVADADPNRIHLTLSFGVISLERNFAAAVSLFRRQLDGIVFTERRRLVERLRAAATAAKAALRTRKNLAICRNRAGAGLLPFGDYQEALTGFHGFQRLQQLAKLPEGGLDEFCATMQAIAQWLRTIPMLCAGFVGADSALAAVDGLIDGHPVASAPMPFAPSVPLDAGFGAATGRREWCLLPSEVASCVRMVRAPGFSSPERLPLTVLGRMLSVGHLWDEIRARGGAYHTRFDYDPRGCNAVLLSSEDPKPSNTYAVFDALEAHLEKCPPDEAATARAVIATAGGYLHPFRPSDLCLRCAMDLFRHRTAEDFQRDFERLLAVTPGDLRECGLRLLRSGKTAFNDCGAGPAPMPEGFSAIPLH